MTQHTRVYYTLRFIDDHLWEVRKKVIGYKKGAKFKQDFVLYNEEGYGKFSEKDLKQMFQDKSICNFFDDLDRVESFPFPDSFEIEKHTEVVYTEKRSEIVEPNLLLKQLTDGQEPR